jgi:hypothetical protein
MSASSLPSLSSFNPHAVHYFTRSGPATINPSNRVGVPTSAYPSHIIVAASTSPSRATPQSGSVSTPIPLGSQPSPVPIQAPQPRPIVTKGFALGQATSAAIKGQKKERRRQDAIFEPFNAKRPLTPELDAVLKKKSAQWGQWELEESLNSK